MLFSWANFRFWTPLLTFRLPKYSKVWKLVINLSVL
jgi:low affinity Fe/Cu permease